MDELHLRIFPVILGHGKKLFDNGTVPTAFTMTEHVVTSKGVFIACYQRAGEMNATAPLEILIDKYLKSTTK